MEQKQTVVQQIIDKISRLDYSLSSEDSWTELKAYIKSENLIEMEKQQIMDAWDDGNDTEMRGGKYKRIIREKYYNEEYGKQ